MTADAGELALTARNASVEDLVALLRGQQARKVDVVASASSIRAEGGCLVLDDTVPVLNEDGVTMTAGRYRTTDVCDAGPEHSVGSGSEHVNHGFVECHAYRLRGSRVRLGKFHEVLQRGDSALMCFEFPASTPSRMPCLIKVAPQFFNVGRRSTLGSNY